MKKTEMRTDTTYLLCPERRCVLFWDTNSPIPCESRCPFQDKLVKMIVCTGCHELIELPGNHNHLCRVDHDCLDGARISNFQRIGGNRFVVES